MGILIKVHTCQHLILINQVKWCFTCLSSVQLFQFFIVSDVFFPQALAKLKKIPETIKAIMERLEPELKQIVKRSTTQIADHAYQRGENLAQESQPRYGKKTERKRNQLKSPKVKNPKREEYYRSLKNIENWSSITNTKWKRNGIFPSFLQFCRKPWKGACKLLWIDESRLFLYDNVFLLENNKQH